MIDYAQWKKDSKWEADWWGNCVNTLREELLQFDYAERIGLATTTTDRSQYNINCNSASILDIGGGPVSLLLKCFNFDKAVVADPCEFPDWIKIRYKAAGIYYLPVPAEKLLMFLPVEAPFTEAWIYNVLQHTMDPKLIIDNAFTLANTIRIFEFIDTGTSPGHPHDLHAADLDEWLHGKGTVERFREHGADGWCYYGVFSK